MNAQTTVPSIYTQLATLTQLNTQLNLRIQQLLTSNTQLNSQLVQCEQKPQPVNACREVKKDQIEIEEQIKKVDKSYASKIEDARIENPTGVRKLENAQKKEMKDLLKKQERLTKEYRIECNNS